MGKIKKYPKEKEPGKFNQRHPNSKHHNKELEIDTHTTNKKIPHKAQQRAKKKQSKKNKHRARLIVRNLAFTAIEEDLRNHFGQYGQIDEVKILKREDKHMLGCGFVQFNHVQAAAKAIHYLNGKPLLGRNIDCDWALAKDKYQKHENKTNVEGVKVKDEPVDDDNLNEVKPEINEPITEEMPEQEATKIEDENDSDTINDDETDDDQEEVSNDDSQLEMTDTQKSNHKKPKFQSNDTAEGKTVFIKNAPFTATNADIKECLSQFGPLYYALVCIDPMTEHSKGTAFVKFMNKNDADKCLQAPDITLMGHVLEVKAALARDEINKHLSDKSAQRHRDTRNLYLVKEGVVLAGSRAAQGVSAFDMAKRLQLEQYKTQMLRNLNMIVARTRLVVHNIPETWDDNRLRSLFKKYTNPGEFIKEARIMRNMRSLDSKGVGKSKEFGFVTFGKHETALEALRAINNNPSVFTLNKRPIVAFSIENRAKLHAKEKRLHNSRIKNPKYKNYDPKAVKDRPKLEPIQTSTNESKKQKFVGVAATPGIKKMRSKFNLKTQAKLHHEQLKKEKKDKKFTKKTLEQKRADFTKQPRQKINKNLIKEKDTFSKLVNQYKKQFFGSSSEIQEKKKWFSE